MENKEAVEIFNKWMDCKDAYQADPSCDGNCLSCEYYTSAEGEKEAMLLAIAALEQQGEDNEWCLDCKEYDKEQHCCHRFTKVIRQAVEEHQREWPDGKWTPVSEALPEDYTDVLVWFEYFRYGDYNCMYQTYGIGTYSARYDSWMINHESGWHKLRVIAWRPLPEAYTEEEE